MAEYLTHPMIKPKSVQARVYQQMIFASAMKSNTLVVLPTGLGKTIIMIMMIAKILNKQNGGKIIMIAPTRPLLEQHLNSMYKLLNINDGSAVIISGEINPEKREVIWKNSQIFICTPQTLRNDIISNYIDLTLVNLMIFDEVHRAVGEDPYVLPAKEYIRRNPKGHIVGFTASPGKKEVMEEIIRNLSVTNIEYMDETHPQVKPYIQSVKEHWELIEVPDELKTIITCLEQFIQHYLQILKNYEFVDSIQISKFSKKKMLNLPGILRTQRNNIGDTVYFDSMRAYGQIMLASHALEVLETQGINTMLDYYNSKESELKQTNKKSLRSFLTNSYVDESRRQAIKLKEANFVHPKVIYLLELIKNEIQTETDPRILIFANYKSTVQYLVNILGNIEGIKAQKFVGQSSSKTSKGLTQKEQRLIMQNFHLGELNTLVSTRVGEEGIDVAQCTLVIFYDMTPSGIRLIQRKGRTGRSRNGQVYYLIAKGTRDESYFHVSRYQKNQVKNDIKEVLNQITTEFKQDHSEGNLNDFFDPTEVQENNTIGTIDSTPLSEAALPKVIVDSREKSSKLLDTLLQLPINLIHEKLEIGDVQISNRVGIERKTIEDFCKSVIDKRLFKQLKLLSNYYTYPILILEGRYPGNCNLGENAFQGALLSVIMDFNIQLIQTENSEETAKIISKMVVKEQLDKKQSNISTSPVSSKDTYEKQIILLSSIPYIDRTIAIRLLDKFRSIKAVVDADADDLRTIKGLGPTKIQTMKEFLIEKIDFQ